MLNRYLSIAALTVTVVAGVVVVSSILDRRDLPADLSDLPPTAAGIATCGEPPLLKSIEAAALVWEDCESGTWNLTVTAGGSKTPVDYVGSIKSKSAASDIARDSFESDDELDTRNLGELLFNLHVDGRGKDQFSFRHPDSADVCFTLDTPGSEILVGPNRTPVQTPVNLRTMQPCASAAVVETCGQPPLLKDTEAAAVAWEDCGSGTWNLVVTGGGSSAILDFTGSVSSKQAATSIISSAMENDDVLDTSDPKHVKFEMHVAGPGKDQLSFKHPATADVCVALNQPGKQLLVGPNRSPVDTPIDLRTMTACTVVNEDVVSTEPEPAPAPVPDVIPDPAPTHDVYAYLDDVDRADSIVYVGSSDIGSKPFPRLTLGPIKTTGSPAMIAKHGGAAVKGFAFDWLAKVQSFNPDFKGMRIYCPQEYQGWEEQDCRQGSGIPFSSVGPATANCEIYSGHFVYSPGTTLTQSIGATDTTLRVADTKYFEAGQYLVIYDGGPGAFKNAEHALIKGVNATAKTLTVAKRGFKSSPRSHSTGAIVAQHVLGNGNFHPENWAYNMSTASPRDASGRQMNEVSADWLARNWDRDNFGNPHKAVLDGILFDVDFYFFSQGGAWKKADIDNDMVLDNGVLADGDNIWGEGLEAFYAHLRKQLPDVVIVGGVAEARGFTALNGTQLEGWPQHGKYTSAQTHYGDLNGKLNVYSMHMRRGTEGPRYSEAINRQPTLLYADGADVKPTSNAPFRFSFGLALLEDGYYGQQNWHVADPWWDEYSVDVKPGSPTYGHALKSNPSDESAIIANAGWMGYPQGDRYRVFDPAVFSLDRNIMADGDFDGGVGNWASSNVKLSVSTDRVDGKGALHVSKPINLTTSQGEATLKGPAFSVTAGKEYTVVFSAKADRTRAMQVTVADSLQEFLITDDWTRNVATFQASKTSNIRLKFNLGRENTNVWFDSIYVFEGNADVFRRDFDNAVVVVNATPSARTVDLNGTFKRIKGTGQDPINNGKTVSEVTIQPYDTAFLVRP